MPKLTTSDEVRLSYRTVGSGPAIVLHLGAGCDASLWERIGVVDALSPTMTCVLFDHRGHGESDKPRGWEKNTNDRYALDVVELLDELGLERAAFWGYSAGIDVGIRLAQQHPARVSAQVGTGSVGPITVEEYTSWARGRRPQVAAGGWQLLIDGFDRQETVPPPEWMNDAIRATDLQQYLDSLEAIEHTPWTYWDLLPQVMAPTLWVVGEFEDPDDETAQGVSVMPDARQFRVPGVGHIRSFIDADLVLPTVTEFLVQAL